MPLQDPTTPVKALSADMQKIHFRVQVIRFLRLFATAFLTQVAFLPGPSITWKAVVALVPPAVEAVVREIWPSLPVDILLSMLARHSKTPTPASRSGAVADSRWAAPTPTADTPSDAPATPEPDTAAAPPIDIGNITVSGVRFGTLAPAAPMTDTPHPAAMPESTATPAQ